jgi:hypothetical protein
MPISELRKLVRDRLVEFAWSQWTQLGVSGEVTRRDDWAADPEALLLFGLEAGRSDPRLLDELLDWLLLNGRLLSVQRLRNLYSDEDDLRLGEAALAWAAKQGPTVRTLPREPKPGTYPAELLFRAARGSQRTDEMFLRFGLRRGPVRVRRLARFPDVELPIAFAFRLRHLFGPGSRAEVMRLLLTTSATDVPALVAAESSAFAKRNVYETLESLVAGGFVTSFTRGGERRYYLDRSRWAGLFELDADALPRHREWPQLLRAVRRLARWIEREDLDELSDYLLASEARTLVAEIMDDLLFAGVTVSDSRAQGADYWPMFVKAVPATLDALESGRVTSFRRFPVTGELSTSETLDEDRAES